MYLGIRFKLRVPHKDFKFETIFQIYYQTFCTVSENEVASVASNNECDARRLAAVALLQCLIRQESASTPTAPQEGTTRLEDARKG
jgi:hypothetical protein